MKWIITSLICITTAVFLTFIDLNNLEAVVSQLTSSLSNTITTTTSKIPPSANLFNRQILHRARSALTRQTSIMATTNGTQGTQKPRSIRLSLLAREQSEGAGARVRRSIGTPALRHLTPFLMLDHMVSTDAGGFPDHPHRGQETITYLLSGAMDHEDFAGNKGTLEAGDLQFMTAGRGIMHAEMPRDASDGTPNTGMQLWVDLPKELKACEPRYRDLRAAEIPLATLDDGKVTVKVISGRSHGVDSVRELAYTPVWFFDITIQPGGKISQELPAGWNAFAYTLSGVVNFTNGAKDSNTAAATTLPYHNVVFEADGDVVSASVEEGAPDGPARFILVAGQPLEQEIVQYGPFVMTSRDDVYQAVMDFQTNANGFERAQNWRSGIGHVH